MHDDRTITIQISRRGLAILGALLVVSVAGPQGVMVSDDHGKTGSWVQTVRLK
jgi:hypothetical protein